MVRVFVVGCGMTKASLILTNYYLEIKFNDSKT